MPTLGLEEVVCCANRKATASVLPALGNELLLFAQMATLDLVRQVGVKLLFR
jgi:hypothetical protein